MLVIVLTGILTFLVLFFIVVTAKINQSVVVEVIISTSWSKIFMKQNIEDKRDEFLLKAKKEKKDNKKSVKKKIEQWNKQVLTYEKQAESYMSGKKITLLDMLAVFGYNLLVKMKLDSGNELIRQLTRKCESSGYRLLERGQETNGKRNSAIYSYFLIASFTGCIYIGVILSILLVVLMMWMEKELINIVIFAICGFALPTIIGYLPMEELRTRATKRQEEIDRDFPNILSKTALLVTAGMNIVKALGEASSSGTSIIYIEMQRVMKEVGESSSVGAAFSDLQTRCSNRYLDRTISLITKSYSSGNANLAEDLREINRECWLEKKHQSRRMTEVVQNKLFVPTMLMFVGILIVIIIPAMSGFNF